MITLYDQFRERNPEAKCARLFQLIDQYTRQKKTKTIAYKQECEVECPHCSEPFDLTLHSFAQVSNISSFFDETEVALYGELC